MYSCIAGSLTLLNDCPALYFYKDFFNKYKNTGKKNPLSGYAGETRVREKKKLIAKRNLNKIR